MKIRPFAVALSVGIVLATGSALHAEPQKNLPLCEKKELTLEQGPDDAAMSHVEQTFYIKNRAAKACLLRGAPYVRFMSAGGKTAASSPPYAQQPAAVRSAQVVLQPGQQAQFTIRFTTSNPFTPGHCPGRSHTAAILPEGFKLPLTLKIDADACSSLDVSAFERRAER